MIRIKNQSINKLDKIATKWFFIYLFSMFYFRHNNNNKRKSFSSLSTLFGLLLSPSRFISQLKKKQKKISQVARISKKKISIKRTHHRNGAAQAMQTHLFIFVLRLFVCLLFISCLSRFANNQAHIKLNHFIGVFSKVKEAFTRFIMFFF